MLTKKFDTPFGYFEVLHNGNPMEFFIEPGSYNTYFIDGKVPVHPDGCYKAYIETVNMKPGDVIVARYSEPGLEWDSGDEHTLNAVAVLKDYTAGLGCDDTDDLEELWEIYRNEEDANPDSFRTKHRFPYAHWGMTEKTDGFEFRIIDEPKEYLQYAYANKRCKRTIIFLELVWHTNEDEYAWDMVAQLTC